MSYEQMSLFYYNDIW